MLPVQQTSFSRPADHPRGPSLGNCTTACIASIFEVPISQVTVSGDGQSVMRWTRENYPALRAEHRVVSSHETDFDPEGWRQWPEMGSVVNEGYWIANVLSPRVPSFMLTGCGCSERTAGGDPECRWCHGRPDERKLGMQWGLHSVVMLGRDLVWDPHPRRAEGVGPIKSTLTWKVFDPALL